MDKTEFQFAYEWKDIKDGVFKLDFSCAPASDYVDILDQHMDLKRQEVGATCTYGDYAKAFEDGEKEFEARLNEMDVMWQMLWRSAFEEKAAVLTPFWQRKMGMAFRYSK